MCIMPPITLSATINAPIEQVFEIFVSAALHAKVTGASATIDAQVGGAFSVWDGYATGVFEQIEAPTKLRCSWRASDWPTEATSTLTLTFTKQSPTQTMLHLLHTGVPDAFVSDIRDGWQSYYVQPMLEHFHS